MPFTSPLRTALIAIAGSMLLAAPAAAQDEPNAGEPTLGDRLQFSMQVGVSRGLSGLRRAETATSPVSQYQIGTSASWGAGLAYEINPQFGLRGDVDAVFPVIISETSRQATVIGQSVAWLSGVSLTYAPRQLCRSNCATFAVGAGGSFYELNEHKERARMSFPVSANQFVYTTRLGFDLRGSGRFQQFAVSASDYIMKFSSATDAAPLSALHHVVVALRWSPP